VSNLSESTELKIFNFLNLKLQKMFEPQQEQVVAVPSTSLITTFERDVVEFRQQLSSVEDYGTKQHMGRLMEERFSKDYASCAKNTRLMARVLQLTIHDMEKEQVFDMKLVSFLRNHLYSLSLVSHRLLCG